MAAVESEDGKTSTCTKMALYIAARLERRYDNGYIAFWALKQNVEWT